MSTTASGSKNASNEKPPYRPFSERTYYVPFGRYQPGGEFGPPDNDVLVGREGQRAYFIDLLFRMGSRGAFLVTGHRGIGKTSFVKDCLSVHEEEIFERFLNNNVGRAVFWDLLGVSIIGFVVLMALQMASQLIDLLTLPLASGRQIQIHRPFLQFLELLDPLVWILLTPLVLICLYPLLFAWEILHTILENYDFKHTSLLGAAVSVAPAATLWLLPSLYAYAALLAALLVPYVLVYILAVEDPLPGENEIRPIVLLFLKVVLCSALSLQLLYPILTRLLGFPPHCTWRDGYTPSWLCPNQSTEMLGSTKAELGWVVGFFVCLFLLFLLEYQWIVRPFLRQRLGQVRDEPPVWYQSLARLTMPWILFKAWLPVLRVPVNLGFEKLDHRRVIHAMLAGLREEYRRRFLSWKTSGFANLLRFLVTLTLLVLVNFIGSHWFELPVDVKESETKSEQIAKGRNYSDICHRLKGEQLGPSAANLICKLPGGDTFVKIIYYDLFHNKLEATDGDHLLFKLVLPYRRTSWPLDSSKAPFLRKGVHFEVYHILLLSLFFLAGRWLLRRLAILPYEETLRRIDEVMDVLSARTSVTSRTNRWEPVQVFQGWFVDERTRQIDQDPADPRTVEFLFLQILNDIQLTSFRLGGRRNQLISLPCPEVTFVFDELDKLGTRVDPIEKETGGNAQQAEILHAERKRSLELHRLLADLKNLLSSAPARFIFIGGRNLHDEWLADQGSRQPLLTNIFNAEVYLPSLLTDFGRLDHERKMDLKIGLYLQRQHCRATSAFCEAKRKKERSFLGLPIETMRSETFILPWRRKQFKGMDALPIRAVDESQPDDPMGLDETSSKTLNRDFRQFLTYRSKGNPKRLKELLGGFIRPIDKVFDDGAKSYLTKFEHVLTFGDTERFRIQLVARIYRHLAQTFEQRLVHRDDKLAVSLFFLADFLFKFHRRAFSWSNLERVDELAHIHRAPDLREILESLVGQWTERFLHPIRNGMYDFRFRSDLAREVEYISRQSADEMAPFNFTLDESQALKSAYTTNIASLKEKTGSAPIDMIAGLGELHEFDQEYEDARVYYWRAISLLDERISQVAGELVINENEGPKDDADSSAVFAAFVASTRGRRLTRHFLTWGISRLRLMLQIGMTFELTRNFERAGIEYRNANTLATALRQAMLDDSTAAQLFSGSGDDGTMHPLKHLNILFQPVFAEAWIAEKLATAVDTGIGLVEKELWTLRGELPFVKDLQPSYSKSPIDIKASNFSLIMAELHNKAGDLYFYKGRQRVTTEGLEKIKRGQTGHEGYLLRAHYHYAVALHEMRRLVSCRLKSSPHKLGIPFKDAPSWETLEPENWPDILYRSAGGALNDLAEATLGRISLYGLLCKLPVSIQTAPNIQSAKEARDELVRTFIRWTESHSDEDETEFKFRHLGSPDEYQLYNWLGQWTTDPFSVHPASSYFPLIKFERKAYDDDFTRLMVSLQLKMVGSKMLEKGGYIEGAAHELLGVCEIVTHYLWWLLMLSGLLKWTADKRSDQLFVQKLNDSRSPLPLIKDACDKLSSTYPCDLISIALCSLEKANRLFKLGRRAEKEEHGLYLVGNQIPVAQLHLTCSLGLAISHWRENLPTVISGLLSKEWRLPDLPKTIDQASLRKLLKEALVRHSYPMINRLQGLKVLIDDTLLSNDPDPNDPDPVYSEWILELIRLTDELDAPKHFTPLHSGLTYGLAYTQCKLFGQGKMTLEKFRTAAQRDLETSEEMFTLRRAYYENISDMSYLYDDFNDRQLHLSHGIQMAGAEMNALFKYLVTVDEPKLSPG